MIKCRFFRRLSATHEDCCHNLSKPSLNFGEVPKDSLGGLCHFQCVDCNTACACRFAGCKQDAVFDKILCGFHCGRHICAFAESKRAQKCQIIMTTRTKLFYSHIF